jgi:predicted ester cyclase
MFHNRSFIALVALALLVTAAVIQACAPSPTPVPPTPPPPTQAPPTEANKALVRRYMDQVWNAGNLSVLDELDSPNLKRYMSAAAAPIDAAGQRQRLVGLRTVFPDISITIDDLIAEGDRVTVRMTARGTQKVAFMGIPPTGKPVTVTAIDIIRIENGKFVEHWGGPDTMDLVQQLGGVVSAGPAK